MLRVPGNIFAAAAAVLLAGASPAIAQDSPAAGPIAHLPALAGDYFPLQSQAASRLYHIFVRYPEGYAAEPERRWPVVYLLDGDSLFPLLAPQHQLLHYDEDLPQAIVVGIAYGSFDPAVNGRDYDFSAPAPDATEGQGGAPAFLRFLKTELIPAVERRVRADPARRVLVGQSRGGYMVLWSAMADPDLFWGRVASNPSLTPGREALFTAPEARPQRADLGVVLVSGTRERSPERRAGALAWGERWEGAADAPWQANLIELDGGTHAASIGEAYRAAMLWLFSREAAPRR